MSSIKIFMMLYGKLKIILESITKIWKNSLMESTCLTKPAPLSNDPVVNVASCTFCISINNKSEFISYVSFENLQVPWFPNPDRSIYFRIPFHFSTKQFQQTNTPRTKYFGRERTEKQGCRYIPYGTLHLHAHRHMSGRVFRQIHVMSKLIWTFTFTECMFVCMLSDIQ